MMKKKVAIVFGITDNFAFALANVLIGMKRHCKPFWDDIIVFIDDLTEENQRNLSNILPCRFVRMDIDKLGEKYDASLIKQYSFLTLARFECFDLLNDYQYVIWHDVDIMIQGDFSGLLECADKTGIAFTYDTSFRVEQNFFGYLPGYNLLGKLYNAGVMVLKDSLKDYTSMTSYCYRKFNDNPQILRYLDQSVFNMLIQDYGIDVGYISLDKYCCHPTKSNYHEAAIIHAYGTRKFWNDDAYKLQFPEWVYNNNLWLKYYTRKEKEPVSVLIYLSGNQDRYMDHVYSILNQTYKNLNIHIIVEMCARQERIIEDLFCLEDNRINIVRNNDYCGVAYSYKNMPFCRDNLFFCYVDENIVYEPRFIKSQIDYLKKNRDVDAAGEQIIDDWEKYSQEEKELVTLLHNPVNKKSLVARSDSDSINQLFDTEDGFDLLRKLVLTGKIVATFSKKEHYLKGKEIKEYSDSYIESVRKNISTVTNLHVSADEARLLLQPDIVNRCYNGSIFIEMRRQLTRKLLAQLSLQYDREQIKKMLSIDNSYERASCFEIMNAIRDRKILLWGTGIRAKKYLSAYGSDSFYGLVDNNKSLVGEMINGLEVYHPSQFSDWSEYYIIVTPKAYDDIYTQLEAYGLEHGCDFAHGTEFF